MKSISYQLFTSLSSDHDNYWLSFFTSAWSIMKHEGTCGPLFKGPHMEQAYGNLSPSTSQNPTYSLSVSKVTKSSNFCFLLPIFYLDNYTLRSHILPNFYSSYSGCHSNFSWIKNKKRSGAHLKRPQIMIFFILDWKVKSIFLAVIDWDEFTVLYLNACIGPSPCNCIGILIIIATTAFLQGLRPQEGKRIPLNFSFSLNMHNWIVNISLVLLHHVTSLGCAVAKTCVTWTTGRFY